MEVPPVIGADVWMEEKKKKEGTSEWKSDWIKEWLNKRLNEYMNCLKGSIVFVNLSLPHKSTPRSS